MAQCGVNLYWAKDPYFLLICLPRQSRPITIEIVPTIIKTVFMLKPSDVSSITDHLPALVLPKQDYFSIETLTVLITDELSAAFKLICADSSR